MSSSIIASQLIRKFKIYLIMVMKAIELSEVNTPSTQMKRKQIQRELLGTSYLTDSTSSEEKVTNSRNYSRYISNLLQLHLL